MTVIAETPAPAWLPYLFFAIPAAIFLFIVIPALRRRGQASAAKRAQKTRRQAAGDVPIGAGEVIDDPSQFSTDAVLASLAIQPEDHGPAADGLPHNEGWAGTMLGLKSKVSSSSQVLEPHVYWGVHGRYQVFIRVGPDEKIEGGTTMFSNRHIRSITVVRVEAPEFSIESKGGELVASPDSPPEIQELVLPLAADKPTWSNTRIVGGPQGIVAHRSAIDGIENSWAYDLWLCERIADRLELPVLKPARVGPRWKVPYGLGRSLTPKIPAT
jgi:hypothetical protein